MSQPDGHTLYSETAERFARNHLAENARYLSRAHDACYSNSDQRTFLEHAEFHGWAATNLFSVARELRLKEGGLTNAN